MILRPLKGTYIVINATLQVSLVQRRTSETRLLRTLAKGAHRATHKSLIPDIPINKLTARSSKNFMVNMRRSVQATSSTSVGLDEEDEEEVGRERIYSANTCSTTALQRVKTFLNASSGNLRLTSLQELSWRYGGELQGSKKIVAQPQGRCFHCWRVKEGSKQIALNAHFRVRKTVQSANGMRCFHLDGVL